MGTAALPRARTHRAEVEGRRGPTPLPAPGISAQQVCRSWCPRKDLVHQGTQSPPSELEAEMVSGILRPLSQQMEEAAVLLG